MDKKMIAHCGLDCAPCPAFHASERLSMKERQEIADKWAKDYNGSFTAEDVDCVGCTVAAGKHVGYCAMCEIRACSSGRGLQSCASCPEYACAKLEGFFKNAPQARENLAMLRAG